MRKLLIILFVGLSIFGCNSREKQPEKKAAVVDSSLSKQAAMKLIQQGVDFLNQQDVAKAIVSFEGAVQVDPSNLQPYMYLAEIFIKMKSYPQAIGVLERAIDTFPDNGYLFYMLSLSNQGNQTPLPAVLAARRSVELFQAQKNEEGYKQSLLLMESLIKTEQQKQASQTGQMDGSKPPQRTVDSF
ncbi:MAG: tetratricopeptide repeat protein [Candidatus Omnitrophica bacterium]|nr:tetratricopeptide repeat protein [Candidatus Omnitrophota bacterium]